MTTKPEKKIRKDSAPKDEESIDLEFQLYSKLANSNNYLHESELESGCLYYINARNAHLGIWIPKKSGFIISRFKFDANYLFIEYHFDTGTPYGTVKPFIKIEKVPFDNMQIQRLGQDTVPSSKNKLYESILNYLNLKADEVPFLWIEDKINN